MVGAVRCTSSLMPSLLAPSPLASASPVSSTPGNIHLGNMIEVTASMLKGQACRGRPQDWESFCLSLLPRCSELNPRCTKHELAEDPQSSCELPRKAYLPLSLPPKSFHSPTPYLMILSSPSRSRCLFLSLSPSPSTTSDVYSDLQVVEVNCPLIDFSVRDVYIKAGDKRLQDTQPRPLTLGCCCTPWNPV